jgi:hypothetical protein
MSSKSPKKAVKKKAKKRATSYEPKINFDGSFKDLIDISIKDANKKKKEKKD